MTVTVTIASLQNNYLNYLQSQNSQINAFAPNTYWSIQAGAMAATFLDLYGNLNLIQNSIYVQNAQGNQCDLWLYSRGLTARGGQTYGTINTNVTSTVPVTIPINTVFTDSDTGNQYQTLQEVTIPDDTTVLTLYAIQPGNNYIEPKNNHLTSDAITVIVLTSTNGQLLESDQSCIARTLQSVRVPQGGSRTTDYFEFCLQSNSTLPTPSVTFAIIEPDFIVINSVNILGAFVLVGTAITEYQLNQGLLPATTFVGYSREAGTDVIDNANTYIQSQRLVGLTVIVGTTITYLATSGMALFNLTVSLVEGYTLATPITITSQDNAGNPISVTLTVEQLIQRETRRAICNQPFGGVNIAGQNYITTDSIIYALNTQLSATNGILAQVLTNINTSNSDIAVPNLDYSAVNVYYTYDITEYSDIVVTAV
jgi:hypothetical protein